MRIRILFFAMIRERTGIAETDLRLPEATTVRTLMRELKIRHPTLESIPVLRAAVNREFVDDDYSLHEGDEVALIPPVSGGV